jgi:hypothetical protein
MAAVILVRVHKVVNRLNAPRKLCEVAFASPKVHHRILAGVMIGCCGVGIAKSPEYFHVHVEVATYFADVIGYGIHGIGLTPILECLMKVFSNE